MGFSQIALLALCVTMAFAQSSTIPQQQEQIEPVMVADPLEMLEMFRKYLESLRRPCQRHHHKQQDQSKDFSTTLSAYFPTFTTPTVEASGTPAAAPGIPRSNESNSPNVVPESPNRNDREDGANSDGNSNSLPDTNNNQNNGSQTSMDTQNPIGKNQNNEQSTTTSRSTTAM